MAKILRSIAFWIVLVSVGRGTASAQTSPAIAWDQSSLSAVTGFALTVDGVRFDYGLAPLKADGTCGCSIPIPFSGGQHSVAVSAYNSAGETLSAPIAVGPVASAGGPYSGQVGTVLLVNGGGSSDPTGSIWTYTWTWGDGTSSSGSSSQASHTYTASGSFTVALTITDNGGATSTDTTTASIAAVAPAVPGAAASPSPASGATGVSTSPSLTWTASGATSYDVRFGTSNPPSAVSSGQTGAIYTPPAALANGTVYYWQIVARNSAGSTTGPVWSFTTAAAAPAAGLPLPWSALDIGSVGLAGSASYNNGVYTVKGAGADIWNTTDAFHYLTQPVSGDTQIVARVTSLQNTNTYAKAGVMLRSSLTANSAFVMLDVRPGGGIEFMIRASTGATATLKTLTRSIPVWLKLTRSGSTVSGYVSSDGTTWTLVGSTTSSIPASANLGLVVCSHTTSALTTATFDSVTAGVAAPAPVTVPGAPASPSPGSGSTGVSTSPTLTWTASGATSYDVRFGMSNPPSAVSSGQTGAIYTPPAALANGTVYYWQIVARNSAGSTTGPVWSFTTAAAAPSIGLPSPWTDSDVGAVGLAGSASYGNGVYTVKGAGADIWSSTDAFNYVTQPISGDAQIVARVTSLQNTNTYAKAGVMLRTSLTANSAFVMLDVRPGGGIEFMTRASTGATATLRTLTRSIPVWLKLTRSGSTVSGYVSSDGTTWTRVGSTTSSIPASANLGLVVCSHTTSALATASFDSVTTVP